jgi:hypothetical protein
VAQVNQTFDREMFDMLGDADATSSVSLRPMPLQRATLHDSAGKTAFAVLHGSVGGFAAQKEETSSGLRPRPDPPW